jgi:hypothetical protein
MTLPPSLPLFNKGMQKGAGGCTRSPRNMFPTTAELGPSPMLDHFHNAKGAAGYVSFVLTKLQHMHVFRVLEVQ